MDENRKNGCCKYRLNQKVLEAVKFVFLKDYAISVEYFLNLSAFPTFEV